MVNLTQTRMTSLDGIVGAELVTEDARALDDNLRAIQKATAAKVVEVELVVDSPKDGSNFIVLGRNGVSQDLGTRVSLMPEGKNTSFMQATRGTDADNRLEIYGVNGISEVTSYTLFGGGEFVGYLNLYGKANFDDIIIDLAQSMLGTFVSETSRLARMAAFDVMTGTRRKHLFDEDLQKQIAQSYRIQGNFGLLYIDVNKFKEINDQDGHPMGNKVLEAVSIGMKRALREADIVYRLGGDEFGILLPDITNESDLETISVRIQEYVSNETSKIEGYGKPVKLSIGGTTFQSYQSEIFMEYLKNNEVVDELGPRLKDPNQKVEYEKIASIMTKVADAAMYESKGKGREGFITLYVKGTDAIVEKLSVNGQEIVGDQFTMLTSSAYPVNVDDGIFKVESATYGKSGVNLNPVKFKLVKNLIPAA